MINVSPARESALRILRLVEEKGGYANHLLESEFVRKSLKPADRKLAYLLVYGVLRHRNRLDWVIRQYSARPLEDMTLWIRNTLRLGAYQLLEMPGSRPGIAVDESVRLAHKYGHAGTKALVNAILRRLAIQGQGLLPTLEENPEQYLLVTQSHPRWIVRRWLKRYGADLAAKICRANNEPAPLTIRHNRIKAEGSDEQVSDWKGYLDAPVQSRLISEGFMIKGPRPISAHMLYREGIIDIQALSSMFIGHLLDVDTGQNVLDACAGSGGKSCHIADLMKNQGVVICVDHNDKKLKALNKRAQRLGAGICRAVCGRSDGYTAWKEGGFDRVLVDAPCSALGIIKRHPEIRWIRKEEDIAQLSLLQRNILSHAAKALKKGGKLLYCTCSLEPEETDEVMEDFLSKHPCFKPLPLKQSIPKPWQYMADEKGALHIMPFEEGFDGFFAFSVSK